MVWTCVFSHKYSIGGGCPWTQQIVMQLLSKIWRIHEGRSVCNCNFLFLSSAFGGHQKLEVPVILKVFSSLMAVISESQKHKLQ